MPVLSQAEELQSFVRTAPGRHLLIVSDDVLFIAAQRYPHLRPLDHHGRYAVYAIDP
jgi:hypothetical protein